TPPTPHPSPRKSHCKFYSVTVGKRCGVFKTWNYVHALTTRVSGASYCSFKTYEEAAEDYYKAKKANLVQVVRIPGDELTFGPLAEAIM
ncbi:hypothetical protein GALMADRAFT_49895, partial [Galerina marginata CBS 339.88]